MKKIFLLLILLLGCTLPITTHAEDVIQVVPFDDDLGPVTPLPQIDLNLDTITPISDLTSGAKSGEVAGCKSNAPGSLGGIGSNLFGQMPGGLNINSILGSVQGGNISGIINTITGGSQAGQIISSLLGGNGNIGSILNSSSLGNIAGNLLGGGNNPLGNILGGNLGGNLGSLGNLGNIASGPLGLVGGALGGSEVPVNDSRVRSTTERIRGNTQKIQEDQDIQLDVTCVQNVLVRQTSHAFAADFSKTVIEDSNTGNGGLPIYSQNLANDDALLSDAVHLDFIKNVLPNSGLDPKLLPAVQRQVNSEYQSNTQFSLRCPVDGADEFLKDFAKGGFPMLLQTFVYHPQCTPAGAAVAATEHERAAITTRLSEQQELNRQAEGILPKVECMDPGGAGKPLQQCVRYRIVGPATVAGDTLRTGVRAGYEQQARASEIGDLVDSLFAQLAQQAFTSLKGLAGLSQKSSTGQGSYLDNVTNNSQNSAVLQAQTTLRISVESALSTEHAYQIVLSDMLYNLEATKSAYGAVQSCYQTLVTAGGGTGIDLAGATLRMNQASSTIQTVIAPQIALSSNAFDDSQGVSAALESLQEQIASARSAAEINALSDAYNGLVAYGGIHTQSDLAALENDRDASEELLNGMVLEANAALTQCQAY